MSLFGSVWMPRKKRTFVSICLGALVIAQLTDAQCTYAYLNSVLNQCMEDASGTADTKWLFPFGTIGQQSDLCSYVGAALKTCINNIFDGCKQDAKSLKLFRDKGDNLVSAYTNLCANELKAEARACMSVVSSAHRTTYGTAQATFATNVDALPTTATDIEICGLATTLKNTALVTILPTYCTDSKHLAVWQGFYSTILDTYACASCLAGNDAVANRCTSLMLMVALHVSLLCETMQSYLFC
ncbi:uncharacterized protein LOC127867917 [Dreissena polymorpha]|uniref:Uncharacterized protein n=1 Tax=Dreissena polymorpha TaxID=45954 RepID=A0A9D4M3Q8_DREPO|nr:uncharacterized protein LOC127867917 [Dreissena polymorpha]KAH3868998.1 hypothetical protein DPMN_032154 [Dreissena polymorpha]